MDFIHSREAQQRRSFESKLLVFKKQKAEQQRAFQERQAEEIKSFKSKYITGVQTLGYCKSPNLFEFYSEHLVDYQTCNKGINTSCLYHKPPQENDKNSKRYFDGMIKEIKKRSEEDEILYFRRIILYSEENLPWIKNLCEQLNGTCSFSLAVMVDKTVEIHDKDTIENSPFALNVVTVDSKKSYLLLTTTDSSGNVERGDVVIGSELITKQLIEYYKRLWSKSIPIMVRGVYKKNPWIPTNEKTS